MLTADTPALSEVLDTDKWNPDAPDTSDIWRVGMVYTLSFDGKWLEPLNTMTIKPGESVADHERREAAERKLSADRVRIAVCVA